MNLLNKNYCKNLTICAEYIAKAKNTKRIFIAIILQIVHSIKIPEASLHD